MKNIYDRWLSLGDEFALLYLRSSVHSFATVAPLFCVGHFLESYFKSCLLFQDSNTDVFKYGHKLFEILKDLQANDPSFLNEINIPENYYHEYKAIKCFHKNRDEEEAKEFMKKEYLLLPFKYSKDLKYFGTSISQKNYGHANEDMGWGLIFPDERYAKIIYLIRKYCNYDLTHDHLHNTYKNNSYFPNTKRFLEIALGLVDNTGINLS